MKNLRVAPVLHGTAALIALAMLLLPVRGAICQTPASAADEVRRVCSNLPFRMPEIPVPSFPDTNFNISDFGAAGDGHTLNTEAIGKAIRACAKAGGGSVVIPPGTWLTGPIRLESNINLHLERGALIQFSRSIGDYPFIPGLDGKSKRFIVTPPLSAYGDSNIAVTGEGVLDGGGEAWRYVKKEKLTPSQWKALVASGGVVSSDGKEWWPSREAMEGETTLRELEQSGKKLSAQDYAQTKEFLRPDLVRFVRCRGILLDGPTFQNSPRFHIHPAECQDLIIRNIRIFTEWYAQNGDGLDLSSCRNAVIVNVTASVGDDGICLKPGATSHPMWDGPACENIVVADCKVYRAHGGFVIGSESAGGARNIAVRNCIFSGTDVGLRFKSLRGKGGLIENVDIDGIRMRAIEDEAILFDMFYGGAAPEEEATKNLGEAKPQQADARTPRFRKFSIRNVVCDGAARAMLIHGLPEMPVRNLTFENLSIAARKGVLCIDADSLTITGSRIFPDESPVIALTECRNVTLRRLDFPEHSPLFLKADGGRTAGVHLVDVDLKKAVSGISLGKDVDPGSVSAKQP